MRFKKKVLSLALSLFMLLGMFPAAAFAVDTDDKGYAFVDMPNNWSTSAIDKAIGNGLLKGYAEGNKMFIKPDAPLKRAEMAAVVNRAFGAVKNANLSGVTDIAATDWYAEDMGKAVMMGTFMEDVKMRPEANITRQEAFVVLARAFLISSDTQANTGLEGFLDAEEVADWAKKDINAMAEAGYIKGSNGKLNLKANISRAEFATVMDNLVKKYIDTEGEVTELTGLGNVLIRVSGVTLKNLTINGDLIIADGVDEGNVTLDNVKVEGRTVVRGGGENSIIVKGKSDLGKVTVYKVHGKVRIAVDGASKVDIVYVADGSNDVFIEGKVGILEVAGNGITAIATKASISNAIVSGDNSKIILKSNSSLNEGIIRGFNSNILAEKGTSVEKIIIKGKNANVEGLGNVKNVDVMDGGDNASVTTPNTKIETAKSVTGVTAAGGAAVEGGSSVTNNGTGTWIVKPSAGGGGSSVQGVKNISIYNNPGKITYYEGENIDLAGLKVKLLFSDGSSEIVELENLADKGIVTVPENGTILTKSEHHGKRIRVIYNGMSDEGDTLSVLDLPSSPFAGGDGSEGSPYQVSTAAQLNSVRDYLDKYFVQTADIDLSGYDNWTPIGSINNGFVGDYNGNGYKINNMKVTESSDSRTFGLFGFVGSAAIKNIQIRDAYVVAAHTYEQQVGILAGYISNTEVINCSTTGTVGGSATYQSLFCVGGLIGLAHSGSMIEACYSCADVVTKGAGLVGNMQNNVIVRNSYSAGTVDSGAGFVNDCFGEIKYSYTSAIVNNGNLFAGYISGIEAIGSYYSDSGSAMSAVGSGPGGGITGLSREDMVKQSSFIDWDFTNGWAIKEGISYPYLQWQGDELIPMPPFAGGAGSVDNPYKISTPEHLNNVKYYPNAHFLQLNDIDLTDYLAVGGAGYNKGAGWNPIYNFKGSYDGNDKKITGLKIDRTDSKWYYVGLFGSVDEGAIIKNLTLTDVDIEGNERVGSLVGNNEGTITNCSVSGNGSTVKGIGGVGGLIGENNGGGTILQSFSACNVEGIQNVGGLVGENYEAGIVEKCFSNSFVKGTGTGNTAECTGGLVGRNYSTKIENSYAAGNVEGIKKVGGLVGENEYDAEIKNCYSAGKVAGDSNVGGLVGINYNRAVVTNSYWDKNTSGQDNSAGGAGAIGKTTMEMIDKTTFDGWDFTEGAGIWTINSVLDSYPYLQWQGDELIPMPPFAGGAGSVDNPYKISTPEHLNNVRYYPNAHFLQLNDIDLTDYLAVGGAGYNNGAGWEPIKDFKGSYDGNDKKIIGLKIDRADSSNVGVFGKVGSGASIKKITIENASVKGSYAVGCLLGYNAGGRIEDCHSNGAVEVSSWGSGIGGLVGVNYANGYLISCSSEGSVYAPDCHYVGGLAGQNMEGSIIDSYSACDVVGGDYYIGGLTGSNLADSNPNSKIERCFATGNVTGGECVGGLVGDNMQNAKIIDSYAMGEITGRKRVGGLVGYNYYGGSNTVINRCYSTGKVNGNSDIGGLVGKNESASVLDSYWDTETSLQNNSSGGSGKNTEEMHTQSTFEGWDFSVTWGIDSDENEGYPFLKWQL
ncbi:MAG: GLUG motif-containing protein [Anaerovoracaceae bacterium]|jgi:hypothetical protein